MLSRFFKAVYVHGFLCKLDEACIISPVETQPSLISSLFHDSIFIHKLRSVVKKSFGI